MIVTSPFLANRLRGLTAWARPAAYTAGSLAAAAGTATWAQATGGNQPAVVGNNASFDGTNDFLTAGAGTGRIQDLFGASAKTMFLVVTINAATLNNTPALYTNDSPFCDTGGYFGIFTRSAGKIAAYNWDANADQVEMDYTFGTKVVISVTHDGVNLRFALNGSAWASVASGATQVVTGGMVLGRSYTGAYSNFVLHELITYNVVQEDLYINKMRQSLMAYHKAI